jgi:hypothetical protein
MDWQARKQSIVEHSVGEWAKSGSSLPEWSLTDFGICICQWNDDDLEISWSYLIIILSGMQIGLKL